MTNVSITTAIQAAGLFTLLVIVMALFGKLIGGFVGSRIAGFDSYDSLIFGVGVMPRAGVELVVISAGRGMGIIGDEIGLCDRFDGCGLGYRLSCAA